jgi:hypothetical protein
MSLMLDQKYPVKVVGWRKVSETKAFIKVAYQRGGKEVVEEVDPDRVSGCGEIDAGKGRSYTLDMGR